MSATRLTTAGGVAVRRSERAIPYENALKGWLLRLDEERGAAFTSSYEYPGRYTRWDFALASPLLSVETSKRTVTVTALQPRGRPLLPAVQRAFHEAHLAPLESDDTVSVTVPEPDDTNLLEENRSRRPSVFTALRALIAAFASPDDALLGLAGAFGYDLAFQFDPITLRLPRAADKRDVVLYLADEILTVDHYARKATVTDYAFTVDGIATDAIEKVYPKTPQPPAREASGDHAPGEYAHTVRKAFPHFARGDLFETVPGQVFRQPFGEKPSALMERLTRINPSPYGFFINLGRGEYLVGASPEMFVRVTGRRVETCPISGTIARGRDAIEDAAQIQRLLNSEKDATELTMCSDVDRNDKSRVCEPASIRVLGRRQIEMYSRLIHTVDHIEGILRPDCDALDAFLSHAWAVTVTGAPKRRAMQFIEDHEKSARAWYGGAVGLLHFNGDLNTGLTLRTVHIQDGVASVRAGATLLADSDPDEEERETVLKAAAMRAAIRREGDNGPQDEARHAPGEGFDMLLVDHDDSFVHTLGGYFRRAGLSVATVRAPISGATLDRFRPDLLVLSPGPGTPSDFDTEGAIEAARARNIPVFGVCLGLQAMVEACGGRLVQLDVPMHGKASTITTEGGALFAGLAEAITVGRYHSLVADPAALPDTLRVTARTKDGVVMAVEHTDGTMMGVQFHPESIMTLSGDVGMRIVENAVRALLSKKLTQAAE
ncbi:MAG: anthranilate synthase component I [Pseudomonadota bacterium]